MDRFELLRAEEVGAASGWVSPLSQEDRDYFAYLRKVFKRYNITPSKATRLEYDAALLKKHGRIRRQLKIKYPQRPITAGICTKTRSHRRWPRFSIPISEAAKTFTASAAAQKTEKRDVFQSAIPSARRAGSLGLCVGGESAKKCAETERYCEAAVWAASGRADRTCCT